MEPRSKKSRKNQEKLEEKHDLDMLSSLPDSILTHILSFLDTKSAIRTSVLSQRYKLLWTLSPCIDFTLSIFQRGGFDTYEGPISPQTKNSGVVSFESYVNHVLQRREHSNLTMFRISLHKDVDFEFIQNCIDYAARHKVQHLMIRGFVKRKPITLPKMLRTSPSLITLHLSNATSCSIDLPKSLTLPNLKVLRLKNFEFSDKNFNGEVFSGCPSLETLVLSKCSIRPGNKLKVLDVDCANLKNLEIKYWRSPWRCFDEHMINVNAPRLVSFNFQGHIARVNFQDGLSCLEKACIDLCYPTSCFVVNASERKQKTSESFLDMLRHICNIKSLSLSLKTLEVVHVLPGLQERAPVIFENLRFLRFAAENKYREKVMRIESAMRLLEGVASDVVIFNGSKEQKASPECSKIRDKQKAVKHVSIPANVMRFLFESSPSLESLSIEIPRVSSDQE